MNPDLLLAIDASTGLCIMLFTGAAAATMAYLDLRDRGAWDGGA